MNTSYTTSEVKPSERWWWCWFSEFVYNSVNDDDDYDDDVIAIRDGEQNRYAGHFIVTIYHILLTKSKWILKISIIKTVDLAIYLLLSSNAINSPHTHAPTQDGERKHTFTLIFGLPFSFSVCRIVRLFTEIIRIADERKYEMCQ